MCKYTIFFIYTLIYDIFCLGTLGCYEANGFLELLDMEMGVGEHFAVESKVDGLGARDVDDAALAIDKLFLQGGVVDEGAVFVGAYH